MPNDNVDDVPGKYTAAALVVLGTIWAGVAASANVTGQVLLFGLALVAGSLVMILRPAWRPVFATGLIQYAVVLGFVLMFSIGAGWDNAFVASPCPAFSSFEFDPSVKHCLMMLLVLVIPGFTCFGVAEVARDQGFFAHKTLRFGKLVLLGVSIAVLKGEIGQATRMPPPEKYIESLPIVGTVPPVTGEPDRTLEHRTSIPSSLPLISKVDVYESPLTSEIVVRRYCRSMGVCWFMLRPVGSNPQEDDNNLPKSNWLGGDPCNPAYTEFPRSSSAVIREDKAHGLFFVNGNNHYAADRKTLQFREVSIREILDTTSSPFACIAQAIAGLLAALVLEILRYRARNRLLDIADASSGTLGTDGWLVLDDGSPPIRMDINAGISPGPVLVLAQDAPARVHGPYRGTMTGDKLEVLSGERGEILRRERWFLQSPLDAFAIVVLILAMIPLATLWLT